MASRTQDPFTICPGCRTTLLHPPGAAAIKCPVCSTVTTIGGRAEQIQAKSICSGCGKWLMHPAGVPSIKCTICSQVTNLAQPQAQTNCCQCGTAMMYPRGAPSVKCYVCHTITSVPIHLTVNEALVHELTGGQVALRPVVLSHMRDLFEEGKPIDDRAALQEKMRGVNAKPPPPPLNARHLLAMIERARSDGSWAPVVQAVQAAWSSSRVLNASFLVSEGAPALPQQHGVDLDLVRAVYKAMAESKNPEVLTALNKGLTTLLTRPFVVMELSDLRQFLIIVEHPQFTDAMAENQILTRTAAMMASLASEYKNTLVSWFAGYPAEPFRRLVTVFQLAITCRLYAGRTDMHQDYQIVTSTQVLGILSIANQNARHLPFSEFYNTALNDTIRPERDFQLWRQGAGAFSFCHHPFILNPATKSRIMQLDATAQMDSELQAAVVNMLYSGQQTSPFLLLVVRRDHIVQDTLDQIAGKKWDLKKKLKVKFQGEEAIDAGGVQKEFFQLIMREIFDPRYGMFVYQEDTRLYWFNNISLENELEYELIGVLLGLAIYNSVILDVHFPLVVYKKLMGYMPTMEDLAQLNPQLAHGLMELLRFDGDVESVFCRTFQISYDVLDEVRYYNLKPNGDQIPVTNANRQEFVDLYLRWLLTTSVERQFSAFARGFHRVCGGQALSLFRPEELELLICGSPELDFTALEKVCKYENGFTASSKFIRWFWEIVHNELSLQEKKRLLFFVTGSDRVPIKGLGTLNFVIIRNGGDSMRLPTSHTCFNQLLLPEYKTKQKLKERLSLAISNAEGFGLK